MSGRPRTHDGICSICRSRPSIAGVYRCRECRIEYKRAYRAANPGVERQQERDRYWSDPDKFRGVGRDKYRKYGNSNTPHEHKYANWRVKELVRSGRTPKPSECSLCGESRLRIEAHHPDHSQPERFVWLCSRCHGATRRKEA